MEADAKPSNEPNSAADQAALNIRRIRAMLSMMLLLMAVYALYFGREFFMPVILAFLLALTLTPIVRFLRKRACRKRSRRRCWCCFPWAS